MTSRRTQKNKTRKRTAKPAAKKTACRSTLPPQAYFFGRETELRDITTALHPDARSWGILIDGPGGIGKTALAIRAAYSAPETDFTHKLFLSAKVRELLPEGEYPLRDFMHPNFMTLLAELAVALGEARLAQLAVEQRAEALRSLLAKTRTLLVVDNLETFEESERVTLYEFLGRLPVGCKAIVTSRRRNDIDARIIRLDRLSLDDSLALIAQLAQSNPLLAQADAGERRTLYETTQGNPLLIQWMTGQLDRGRCGSVAEACAFLNAAPADNDPLEYIFGDLLDAFAANEVAALAALSHFRDAAAVQRVAEIADLSVTQTQTALEDLSYRALVTTHPEAHTFYLPPLAATFLQRKAPQAVADSGKRLSDKAGRLVRQYCSHDDYRGFPQLENHWPLLAAAIPRFLAGDNVSLQKLCHRLDKFLEFSGHWDDWLWLSRQAEAKALANGDDYHAGWDAYRAGSVFYLRSQPAEVLAAAQRATQHWHNAGSRERATAHYLSGHGHRLANDIPAAVAAYREAVSLWRNEAMESQDVAIGLNALANAEKDAQDYATAEQHYREALALAEKLDYQEGRAYLTGNLAELDVVQKNWQTAEAPAREALVLAEAVGRHELIALSAQRLANILARLQRAPEGLPLAQRAVEIYTRLNMPGQLAVAQEVLTACTD